MTGNGNNGGRHGREDWSQKRPHEYFLELCAVSTSGELTPEEQRELEAHLAQCAECRQALEEFGTVVDIGVPLLHSHLVPPASEDAIADGNEVPRVIPARESVVASAEVAREQTAPPTAAETLAFTPPRNGHRLSQLHWSLVWMSLAAVLLLTVFLGIYSYQAGSQKAVESSRIALDHQALAHHDGNGTSHGGANGDGGSGVDRRIEALEREISDAGHERELLKAQLAERDRAIADLRREIESSSASLAELRKADSEWTKTKDTANAENQRAAEERGTLTAKAAAAQASLDKAQTELDAVRQQQLRSESAAESLKGQIVDLQAELRRDQEAIGQEEDLLARDRDIRDLMGARDLYIAEVYDVGRDGTTQKPYGRVFYTKGKSLVFYAYDLDQQAGLKNAATFQAWGNRGSDRAAATNLGIFYQDSTSKKRWVVKCDDPRTLEQIDAVFVTVEPNGGSHRPSGKPLLFTYLKLNPNHP